MGLNNLDVSAVPKNLRTIVKKYYPTFTKLIPSRLRYHPDYFEVFRIHQLLDSNDQNEVRITLAKRLAAVLRDAVTFVPYYRDSVKVRPEEINEHTAFDVLKTFPFLDKDTIMQDPGSFLDGRFEKAELAYNTSGGSTGQGIGVWSDLRERQVEKAFFDFEWGKFGFVPFQSKVVRFGIEARKSENEDPWSQKGNRLLISPYHLDDRWLSQIYTRIVDFEPDFFHTYPSCLEMVARHIKNQNLPKIQAKGLFLASEIFTESQYLLFKETFDAPIKAHYGLCEKTNLAFMNENETQTGFYYKTNPIYGISENLPDEHGNQEIIGTSYWTQTMPFIRYRTQDFGLIEANGIIRKLDGRNQAFLYTRTGAKIPGFSIKIDEFTWDFVRIYQVVQYREGSIMLRIVPRSNFNQDIEQQLLLKQEERWGDFFDISIELVQDIPRTRSGKHRLIVNYLE